MTLERLVFANFEPASLPEDIWDRARASADEVVLIDADSPEYRSVAQGADGLILRLGMSADAEFLAGAPRLRYIGMLGTDYGRIDIEAARRQGIVVANIADYSTEAVAEFALGIALEMFRNLSVEQRRAAGGDLEETGFVGRELSALKVGVVGAGNLGRRFAEILSTGIGADVRYWSRRRRPEFETAHGVTYRPLDELVAESDLLSLHVALNHHTTGLVTADMVRSLPRGAGVINTVPNEVIDLEAVLARCAAGELRFATDHADELSPDLADRVHRTPNVLVYPPVGYATSEATRKKLELLVSNIEAFLAGTPTNHVNP